MSNNVDIYYETDRLHLLKENIEENKAKTFVESLTLQQRAQVKILPTKVIEEER